MSLAIATGWHDPGRSPRRQRLVAHLHRCGPRLFLEVLRHAEAGAPVDVVLEAFAGLRPEDYQAADAATFPTFTLITGGRK